MSFFVNSKITKRFGEKVIDVTNKSMISDEFENISAPGRYLYDGTHPTHSGNTTSTLPGAELGAVRLGRCIANEFKNNFYHN